MDASALRNGLRKRCPLCGDGDVFVSYFTIRERCSSCDLRFEREHGYWLGAMIVAMALIIVAFAVVFLGGLARTWPDVPWTGLLIATAAINLLLPVLAYPWCMTVWMGLHHAVVTSDRDEGSQPRYDR